MQIAFPRTPAQEMRMDAKFKDARRSAAVAYLRLAVEKTGLKATEIARRAGLTPSTINRPLSAKGSNSAVDIDTLLRVRKVTKVSFTDEVIVTYGLLNEDSLHGAPDMPQSGHETVPFQSEVPWGPGLPKDVKVLGSSLCGEGDFAMDHLGDPIDYVRRPPGLEKARDVFAVYLAGESLLPWYKPGDLIFLSDKRPPVIQGLVVVELHPKREGDPCPSLFKVLVRRTAEYVELLQANPQKTIKVKTTDIKRIYRVLSNAELLGV